jgi:hypothetical protein
MCVCVCVCVCVWTNECMRSIRCLESFAYTRKHSYARTQINVLREQLGMVADADVVLAKGTCFWSTYLLSFCVSLSLCRSASPSLSVSLSPSLSLFFFDSSGSLSFSGWFCLMPFSSLYLSFFFLLVAHHSTR